VSNATQRGFTLIELMVTIAVAAILMMVVVPGMQSLSQRSQQLNAIGDISAMLNRARSEAAARNKPVTICVSTDGATCSANTTWASGWLMFVDANNNQTWDAGEDVIQVGGALASGTTLTALYFPNASPYAAVTFAKDGALSTNSSGTFRYCIKDGATQKMQAVNVSAAGMARIAVDTDKDGKLENSGGAAILACP
jgi:type IV fimbrial biogenesis protein FimT